MTLNKDELELRAIFNKIDPVGIYFDENDDEYDGEIKEFVTASINRKDYTEVKNELDRIFKKWFEGVSINEEKMVELAKRITER